MNTTIEKEIDTLRGQVGEMEQFFEKQSGVIIQKCITRLVRETRRIGKESPDLKFLGDDFDHLNLFDQISYIALPGDIHIYPGVDNFIYNICEAEYKALSEDDQFILTHQSIDDEEYCPIEDIKSYYIKYATDYTSQKLEKHR